jgi:LPS-assembly lipoprotein
MDYGSAFLSLPGKLGRAATMLVLLTALSACGFHLRGEVLLPTVLQDVYIESRDRYSGMARALRTQLERAGANVLQSPEQASAILKVVRERSENRVLSVGSTGKATEYELFDEVVFSLSDAAGKELMGRQNLRLTRDLVFDQNELLGKLSEAESIHRQMRETLARQVLMRIQATMDRQ